MLKCLEDNAKINLAYQKFDVTVGEAPRTISAEELMLAVNKHIDERLYCPESGTTLDIYIEPDAVDIRCMKAALATLDIAVRES